MLFQSILNEDSTPPDGEFVEVFDFLHDLNLDQVVDAICAGYEEYDLRPFLVAPLKTVEAIEYRHAVARDLEDDRVRRCIGEFAERMRSMRQELAQAAKLRHILQQQRWHLDATTTYCSAVEYLEAEFCRLPVVSRALCRFATYVKGYAQSEKFLAIRAEAHALVQELSAACYCLRVKDNRVTVSRYGGEPDYSREVTETFAKFSQGGTRDHSVAMRESAALNRVEERILEFVARLFPETFAKLARFANHHDGFPDETLVRFDREVHFFVAYLEFVRRFEASDLPFCYPEVSANDKRVLVEGAFDVALARRLLEERQPVVLNDISLRGAERILIVSGPNQGGKTTFARTFGQLHHFARIGCRVPARHAQLFLCDRIFTHFERQERIENLRGKLEDDLIRIRAILDRATPRSIMIINEILSSTALADAVDLGRAIIVRIEELGVLCVFVTFVDQLAVESSTIVSMVSSVDPDDPAVRTFKIVRRGAGGPSYAMSLAEKHRLTYERVRSRLAF